MFIWSKGIIVKFLALISDIYSNSKIALVLSVLLPQWNKLLCWQVLIFFSSLKITLFCCFYFKKDLRQDCSVFFCGFFWWFFFFFFSRYSWFAEYWFTTELYGKPALYFLGGNRGLGQKYLLISHHIYRKWVQWVLMGW